MQDLKGPEARAQAHPAAYSVPGCPAPPAELSLAVGCPLVADGHKVALDLTVTALCPGLSTQVPCEGPECASGPLPNTCPGGEAHLPAEIAESHRPNSSSTELLDFIALLE